MADCFSLPNAAEFVKELRTNGNYIDCFECKYECWQCNDGAKDCMIDVAADAIEQLAKGIDVLTKENAKLKAERDAAVAEVEELNDDFVECVCSGCGNISPYCGNRCAECVDNRGWCKEVTKYCRGFIPMSYKDWRGVKEKEDD